MKFKSQGKIVPLREFYNHSAMKRFKYIVYKEGRYYVSQCLNVDVSSFGKTIEEATQNLREALDLYVADTGFDLHYQKISETMLGELNIRVL